MDFTEKEIENFVFDDLVNNDGITLLEQGFTIPSLLYGHRVLWLRQLNIDPYGIIDIVGFYRNRGTIIVDIIELKAVDIDVNHFEQIARYRQGIKVYLNNTFSDPDIHINCIILGKSYSGLYIQNFSPIDVSTYKFGLTGFQFEYHRAKSGWHIISGKDKSFRKNKSYAKTLY